MRGFGMGPDAVCHGRGNWHDGCSMQGTCHSVGTGFARQESCQYLTERARCVFMVIMAEPCTHRPDPCRFSRGVACPFRVCSADDPRVISAVGLVLFCFPVRSPRLDTGSRSTGTRNPQESHLVWRADVAATLSGLEDEAARYLREGRMTGRLCRALADVARLLGPETEDD